MSSLSGGGMERAMLNLAGLYASKGMGVDLLVASEQGPLINEIPHKVNLVSLKSQPNRYRLWLLKAAFLIDFSLFRLIFFRKLPKAVKVIPSLIQYLKQETPDLILSTPTTANLALVWSARYANYQGRVVIREATTLSQEIRHNPSLFFRVIRKFVTVWYNKADAVICVSKGVKEDLRNNFQADEIRMHVVQNYIDEKQLRYKADSDESRDIIKKYGNFILSAGRLEPEKNYDLLIRAFANIAGKVSHNLVILGEGSQRTHLEILAQELSLADRVFLPGYFVNPYPFIKACEVFALSSVYEGSPNVIREALILDKKIISSDCPSGVRELLDNGRFGVLVETDNENQYSDLLYALLNGQIAVEHPSGNKLGDSTAKLYENILGI